MRAAGLVLVLIVVLAAIFARQWARYGPGAFFPGLALSVLVFGVNVVGDAVRDLLDPRRRE